MYPQSGEPLLAATSIKRFPELISLSFWELNIVRETWAGCGLYGNYAALLEAVSNRTKLKNHYELLQECRARQQRAVGLTDGSMWSMQIEDTSSDDFSGCTRCVLNKAVRRFNIPSIDCRK
jgi:hypothetical protein